MSVIPQLGVMHAHSFETDPKHLGFVLARYQFVARMLAGKRNVLEIGCGDGTGARLVRCVVGNLVGLDTVPPHEYPGLFVRGDLRVNPQNISGGWDAVFALDVLEHIPPEEEQSALGCITKHLRSDGICIIGMPSLESQPFASELSKRHHVNCKTEDELRGTMEKLFRNVFLFGMNDSTLHTGFGPMCHYRLALCAGKR
jgi:SAM-dependent methyltransferase